MHTFRVGDKAVYPAHGVAEVVGIEEKDIGGQVQNFYILKVLENDTTVMIPTSNINLVGVRPIITETEADDVFKVLKKREKIVESTTWNRRYREYMDKIKTGSVIEVAKVLRDLCIIKGEKELSFGERKLLDTAHGLLITEISIAKGITEEEVDKKFKSIFKH